MEYKWYIKELSEMSGPISTAQAMNHLVAMGVSSEKMYLTYREVTPIIYYFHTKEI